MASPDIHIAYISNQPSIHLEWYGINPSIHLAYMLNQPGMLLLSYHHISSKVEACKKESRQNMGNKQIMSSLKALHMDLHTYIHQKRVKLVEQTHACTYECMTYLIYLAATQHLWHYKGTCECVFMASK